MNNIFIFIPVKKNSTRLKNKNLSKIYNMSLLEKKIQICKKLKSVHIIVSTDSEKIKKISLKNKVNEIRIRPKKYSTSKSTLISVVLDYLRYKIKKRENLAKYIAILPVTNPILKLETIKKSIRILRNSKKINSVVSVVPSTFHPYLFVDIKKKIKFNKFKISYQKKKFDRSQDRPKTYILSGALRITRTNYFLKYLKNKNSKFAHPIYDKALSLPIIINSKESHDINNSFDLKVAKILNNINSY